METSGLHKLSFYPRKPCPAFDLSDVTDRDHCEIWLETILHDLTLPPIGEFTKADNTTVTKRKVKYGYTYQDKILLLLSNYLGKIRLSIEINGGAFDSLSLDWPSLFSAVDAAYTITEIHAKIDTTAINFEKLWELQKASSFTANSRKHCDYEDAARSINIGTSDKIYSIYEAGKYHGLPDTAVIRHEIKLKGTNAKQFWEEFFTDQNSLGELVKSHVAGTFGVQFRKITPDKNVARRPVLPAWQRWLEDSKPSYLKHQVKPVMIGKDAERTIKYILKARKHFDSKTFDHILEQVDRLFQASKPAPGIAF